MEIFAKRLRELRLENNLNQSQLAKATGTTSQAINRWEKCQRVPSSEYVIIFANFFDVSCDYLLGLTDSLERLPAKEGK